MAIRGSYCSDEVLLLLMKASKEAAGLVNRNGQLPLHALLASGRTVTTQMVMMLLFFHRDSAAHCDAFGRTPVILAMSSPSVPIDVKLAIIGAASAKGPAAVGIAEQQYGRTALHYCTASDASIEVIRVLVTSAPAAAKVFDKSGKCPLVLALENERATEEVVACLLSAAPSAVVAPLPAGKNALHVAVKRQYSVDTLKSLIEADVVARLSTPSGSTLECYLNALRRQISNGCIYYEIASHAYTIHTVQKFNNAPPQYKLTLHSGKKPSDFKTAGNDG
jgi:hypothetical protein